MRKIVLDTETTGLNAKLGDRVIEIGCIELLDRTVTERHFHVYLNPEREIDEGASRVHGMKAEDLVGKPKFAEIARDFLEHVRGAELIIHNADFDVEFLDAELKLAKLGKIGDYVARITDTLAFARELHPGKKNSLDALCERYAIDHANRTLHGALLDARLLAECWLAMTRGQESLMMELEAPAAAAAAAAGMILDVAKLVVQRASAEELALHESYLDAMAKESKGAPVWRRILQES